MKRHAYILLHLFCWSIVLAGNFYDSYNNLAFKDSLNTSGLNAFSFHLFFNLSYLLDFIVAFYGGYFLIAPLLFNKKKYFLALFFTIVVAALIVWVRYVGEFYVNLPLLKFNNY